MRDEKMRGRWFRRVLWGAVALGLGIVAIFFDHPVKPAPLQTFTRHAAVHVAGYTSNGTLEKPTSADVREVQQALDTRAHAVLTGDRAAFLGIVDDDRQAFARQQRTVWANTQQLPISRLSYTLDGTVEPDNALGTPSFLVHITTTYQLRGFDTSPVVVDDGYTFVRAGGAWKLAAVDDADGQFNARTLPVPWDGPAIQTYGDHDFLAVVDRGHLDLAHRLVALCHLASLASGRLLGVSDHHPTVVVATTHSRGFKALTGPDALAVTYRPLTADGTDAGWRLVLNPGYVDHVAEDPVTLTHELTHLATQSYLSSLPGWLAEGSAEYVGWHDVGGLRSALLARGFTTPRHLPDRLPITPSFYFRHMQLNYSEGLGLVTWIAEHRGAATVRRLMQAYAAAQPGDRDLATPRVLRKVLGMSTAELAHAAYAEMDAAVASPAS